MKTYRILHSAIIAAALFLHCAASDAQDAVGIFNSLKGFGVTYNAQAGDKELNSFTLYADMSGSILENESTPGIKFNYTRIIPITEKMIGDTRFMLYAGAGASTGWVHDYGSPGKCFALALSGSFGFAFNFSRNIVLDLNFRPEVGIKVEDNNVLGNKVVSFYKNGGIQSIIPQLGVLYSFGKKPVKQPRERNSTSLSSFRYGVEWGLTSTFFNYHHYNYYDEDDGYRVNDRGANFKYVTNAYFEAFAGIDLARWMNISMRAGVAGVEKGITLFPVKMRFTATPAGFRNDGVLGFVEFGHAFSQNMNNRPKILGALGSGYRVALTKRISVDFTTSLRAVLDHPKIHDNGGGYVSSRNIKRNNAVYCGLDYSISLNF